MSIRFSCFIPASMRGLIEEPLAHHAANLLHLRRHLQQVRQQPPRAAGPCCRAAPGAAFLSRSKSASVQYFFCEFRVGFFFSSAFFALSIAGVFRVLRNLVVLLLPAQDAHVVLVREREDEALGVELRPAGAAEDLMRRARVDQLLLAERPLHETGQDDRAGRQVDPGRQRFRAERDREQLLLEQVLDRRGGTSAAGPRGGRRRRGAASA